ncbi:MAG: sigma-70 family RNA polymerase sigma factor [Chryseobacterium sp.]|nr:MAG: sigma-70 family RNA polymerase sigma factor [Chryseobacterium sp.]
MNQSEFTSKINHHFQHLLAHALKFTNNEDDAKDLVQETLIKGVRFCEKFDEGTNLRGWLYVIMKNTFINDFRKKVKKNDLITTDDEINSAQLSLSATKNASNTTFAMEDINRAMSSIRKEYSMPFKMYFEGYKYEEISEKLGIPVGTVKTHIHQARLGLKRYLAIYRS